MRILSAVAATALSLGLAAPAHAASSSYHVTPVDFPGAANTALYAINNRGQYVGAEKDTSGLHHAIVYTGGQLALLDPGGPIGSAAESWAYSTNNLGDIAGATLDSAGVHHGYVHHADGAIEIIDIPGGADTQAYGINDNGSVIGVYLDASGNVHTFVRRNGAYASADLPGAFATWPLSINNREQIAGEYQVSEATIGYGFVAWEGGRFHLATAPGSPAEGTFFISINNRFDVLGSYVDDAGAQRNFIREGATYVPFELPAGIDAAGGVSAQTINDRLDMVGYYVDSHGVAHGYLAKRVRATEQ